jgi:hypothetical protein
VCQVPISPMGMLAVSFGSEWATASPTESARDRNAKQRAGGASLAAAADALTVPIAANLMMADVTATAVARTPVGKASRTHMLAASHPKQRVAWTANPTSTTSRVLISGAHSSVLAAKASTRNRAACSRDGTSVGVGG